MVAVSATPAASYQFTGFTGGLTGTASPQNVTLTAPVTVTAGFIALQTVTTVPPGLLLTVDAAPCTSPCTFPWTSGSSHALAAVTIAGPTGTQSVFVAWSQGGSASQTITAADTPTIYTATYKTQYYLTTSAGTGGSIAPASAWYDAGTPVSISATPDSLYYFAAFSGDLSGATTPQTVSLTAPKSIAASFATIPTTMVTTSPSALQVTVDGTVCTAPCAFQWTPGTSHTLTAATQPGTAGAQYAFASWSQGGAASQTISASNSTTTYAAAFNLQYLLTTAASPIAGGTITPASGWYNSGAVISVGATANTGYQFTGFSAPLSGATTPQSVTMNAPVTVTASFQALPTTTIQSVPAGLTFTVDNVACVSPCLIQWIPGSGHAIIAGTQITGSNTQYVFASWNQGTSAAQTITAPSANFTYTATFTAQYAVSAYVGPSAAGNITLNPPGGWYSPGTQVTVGAAVNPGWAFTGFTGAINSAVAPQVLTVNAPVTLTANFTPDFALAIPTPVITQVNGSVQFTVTVTGQNGFNDSVTFDAPLLPTGATATFNPATVYGNGTSTVTITAPSAGGTFAFTLRGTAGAASSGLTHGVIGSLAVQDFTVTPVATTVSGGVGDTVQYVFSIAPLGGFNGAVTIVPASITIAPNPPANKYCSASAIGQQSGAGTVTLSITLSLCSEWPFTIPLVFTSNGISHSATVQLVGVTTGIFNLSSPSSPQTVSANALATFPIHVATNFSGTYVTFPNNLMTASCGTIRSFPAPGDRSRRHFVHPRHHGLLARQQHRHRDRPRHSQPDRHPGPCHTVLSSAPPRPPISPSSPRPPPAP